MKHKKILVPLFILIALVGLGIYYFVDPSSTYLMPVCPTHKLFGIQCPGCGIQRALHALLQGHFREAIHFNYFMLYSIPYFGLVALERWFLPDGKLQMGIRKVVEHRIAIYLYIVLFFVWFVVRNILGI